MKTSTHALLSIFPDESWVREWIRIQVGYAWKGKIGHFRVPPVLNSIKTRLNAQPLIWKWFFILMQVKPIFTRKVVHFSKSVILELGSGLFDLNTVTCGNPETKSCGFKNIWIRVVGVLGSSFTQFSCTWQKYPQQVASLRKRWF